ncbi:MAG: biopolymer transporter ExbD [bacterium]|jgi:biopolymer transport protein ExbD|nr:hypothetical protein [Gammaproteobacteria bacterium]HIL84393.1 hypothetical protein [Pseudomonadales bacterium]
MFNFGENDKPVVRLEGNMIPVVSMTFLLLLFFIVAGSLSNDLSQDIHPPRSISEEQMQVDDVELILTLDGIIIWENKKTSISSWAAGFRADGLTIPARVRLRADSATSATLFMPILEDLKNVNVDEVVLVTIDSDDLL